MKSSLFRVYCSLKTWTELVQLFLGLVVLWPGNGGKDFVAGQLGQGRLSLHRQYRVFVDYSLSLSLKPFIFIFYQFIFMEHQDPFTHSLLYISIIWAKVKIHP